MQNLRSLALGAAGIAIVAVAAVFTLSLTLFLGALLSISLLARMVMGRARPAPAHVRTEKRGGTELRIWNDGRGTIIDM